MSDDIHLEQLERDGYTIIPAVLSPEEVRVAREAVVELLDAEEKVARGTGTQTDNLRMHRVCTEALIACEAAVQPGRSMGMVYKAHAEVMDSAGFSDHRMHACGYGMGAVYNPLWVDPPMFYQDNPLIMQTGNVFFLHIILANSDTGRAMTLGHSVLVTADGCERLSRSSLELVIN